jgi:hypothetical protein
VNFPEAMSIVGSRVHLPGRSDDSLLHEVRALPDFVSPAKALSLAAGLEAGVSLRPVEALHELSYATRPRYQDDLLDTYVQWGLLRYLGFFDLADYPYSPLQLTVSEAGQRIVGNQRRVTSEEMGIGFGVLLAKRWFRTTIGYGTPIRVVDIDAALDDRYILATGSPQAVRKTGLRRPDYLIIADDPAVRRHYRVRLLECKGTSTTLTYAVQQLASAVEQLAGVAVGGRIPAGLAVSTITANNRVSYLAIDPEDAEEASYEVSSDTIDQAASFRFSDEDPAYVSPSRLNAAKLAILRRSGWVPGPRCLGAVGCGGGWSAGAAERPSD